MPTDRGSTIPFILGMFLIALLLAGGCVAAGDAFVQQSQLQDTCDGAALAAAASAANVNGQRHSPGGRYLVLAAVQTAVDRYHGEDPARRDVTMRATLANDDATVAVHCTQTRSIAFGAWFGFRDGVHHEATSTAKAPLREA